MDKRFALPRRPAISMPGPGGPRYGSSRFRLAVASGVAGVLLGMAALAGRTATAATDAGGPVPAGTAGSAAARSATGLVFRRPRSWQVDEALIHWRRGRIREAGQLLVEALHEDPQSLEIATWLIDVHLKLEEDHEAIKLLKKYAHLSTRRRNLFYRLGLAHARRKEYRTALGDFTRALELDPHLLRAWVEIAKIRSLQGFVYDAAAALRSALQVRSDYRPAIEQLQIVNERIRSDKFNDIQRENLVVHFRQHGQLDTVEAFLPLMLAHRENLEDKLKYRIPVIHVRIVPEIQRHFQPPVFYDDLEDSILVSDAALIRGDHVAFGHELAWQYLTRMTRKNAPRWLVEGLALMESRPEFLDARPLHTTRIRWADLDHRLTAEKRFLAFDDLARLGPEVEESLRGSYSVVRFLLEIGGWPAMRQILREYRTGQTRFEPICEKVLHIDFPRLSAKYDTYAISNFFFHTTGEHDPKIPVFR